MTIKNIFFDLDGTLTNSEEGIIKSITYALKSLNAAPPSHQELKACIGPPLTTSFQKILDTSDNDIINKAIELYRERYNSTGKFENIPYTQIEEQLETLQEDDFNLFLVTSKMIQFAKDIISHFELALYFQEIYGAQNDGTFSNKSELVEHVLTTHSLKANETIMVGDRHHDIDAAKSNNIYSMGVTYGFGSIEELQKANADWICTDPEQVALKLKQIDLELRVAARK